jgi:hypothetical protein
MTSKQKCDDGTEAIPQEEFQKMFPTVAALLG